MQWWVKFGSWLISRELKIFSLDVINEIAAHFNISAEARFIHNMGFRLSEQSILLFTAECIGEAAAATAGAFNSLIFLFSLSLSHSGAALRGGSEQTEAFALYTSEPREQFYCTLPECARIKFLTTRRPSSARPLAVQMCYVLNIHKERARGTVGAWKDVNYHWVRSAF